MRNLRSFALLFLLITVVVLTVFAQKGVKRPEPGLDRARFEKSAKSIARPDFLACRNNDAKLTRGSDLTVEEFSRMLHGVWVNQNRRTVHGMPVETDAAFYVDIRGGTGTAVLIDRNNLGDYPLTSPYVGNPGSNKALRTARPLTMTFINCTYQFFDQYIKVADDVPRRVLGSSTEPGMKVKVNEPLKEVWDQIVNAGYFNSFQMVTSKGLGMQRSEMSTRQGDGKRVAVLPDGTRTTEKRIEEGFEPGSEYNLPMMTGAIFRITLTPKKNESVGYQSVTMRWDAEYRGVGIAIPVGEQVPGVEQGEFFKEGNACVSSISLSGPNVWTTSECGDKNGLVGADAVSNPAIAGTNLKPTLIFDRVVIGAP